MLQQLHKEGHHIHHVVSNPINADPPADSAASRYANEPLHRSFNQFVQENGFFTLALCVLPLRVCVCLIIWSLFQRVYETASCLLLGVMWLFTVTVQMSFFIESVAVIHLWNDSDNVCEIDSDNLSTAGATALQLLSIIISFFLFFNCWISTKFWLILLFFSFLLFSFLLFCLQHRSVLAHLTGPSWRLFSVSPVFLHQTVQRSLQWTYSSLCKHFKIYFRYLSFNCYSLYSCK